MMLSTVNFGGSMSPMAAIHWRMASFPLTVLSPTIVHSTSSEQKDRNPSVLPLANAAFTFSMIPLLFCDILVPPMFSFRVLNHLSTGVSVQLADTRHKGSSYRNRSS